MTDKEKAAYLLDAIQDIERILASMAQLGNKSKDEAIQIFEDSCVVIAGITTTVQAKVGSQ